MRDQHEHQPRRFSGKILKAHLSPHFVFMRAVEGKAPLTASGLDVAALSWMEPKAVGFTTSINSLHHCNPTPDQRVIEDHWATKSIQFLPLAMGCDLIQSSPNLPARFAAPICRDAEKPGGRGRAEDSDVADSTTLELQSRYYARGFAVPILVVLLQRTKLPVQSLDGCLVKV